MQFFFKEELHQPRIVAGPLNLFLGVQRREEVNLPCARLQCGLPDTQLAAALLEAPPWQPRTAVRATSYEAGWSL